MSTIIERVKNILTTPKTEWQVIAGETTTVADLYKNWIILLAAIPAIVGLIGGILFGMPLVAGILMTVLGYVLGLVMVYVVALIINALAPTFGAQQDQVQALKTIAYAWTASWVAGIAAFVPLVGALIGLAGMIYSAYLLYLGLPATMKCPPEKAVAYTVVSIICAIVISFVITFIVGIIVGVIAVA